LDAERFDVLVKAFSGTGSRRGAVGALLASTLGLLGQGEVSLGARRSKHQAHQERKRRRPHEKRRQDTKDRAKENKKKCAGTGASLSKRRKRCCAGLVLDAFGRCATPPGAVAAPPDSSVVPPPPPVPCAQRCPDGCCAGAVCISPPTQAQCGLQGVPCLACGPNQSCGNGVCQGGGGCLLTTCAREGKDCGTINDGCGRTLTCGANNGACPLVGQPCVNNVCGVCVPNCTGRACGADDDCGGPCLAGSCPASPPNQTCGGGNPGTPGVCGCTPDDPCSAGVCGMVADRCGTLVDCGETCAVGQICSEHVCVTGQGSCAVNADFCLNTSNNCNGICQCRISTEGDTRCSGLAPGGGNDCGECGQSSDCAVLYPAIRGVFCMAGGTGCCNGTAPRGLCHAPCPV